VVDCCIAKIAVAYDATIVHDDRDFATIAKLRSPKHLQFGAPGAAGFHEPGASFLTLNIQPRFCLNFRA
jgi:hypothetical protein